MPRLNVKLELYYMQYTVNYTCIGFINTTLNYKRVYYNCHNNLLCRIMTTMKAKYFSYRKTHTTNLNIMCALNNFKNLSSFLYCHMSLF